MVMVVIHVRTYIVRIRPRTIGACLLKVLPRKECEPRKVVGTLQQEGLFCPGLRASVDY
jgi:hypothetical protein